MTRTGVDRVLRYAYELAATRPRKKLTSATKSNGISISMPYWDERFAELAKAYPEVRDFIRRFSAAPAQAQLALDNTPSDGPARPARKAPARTWRARR